jgi:glucose-6-phosphate 1-dehydrogenase
MSAGLRVHVREGLCIEQKPNPCGLVIFGASGDLARRKLFPALRELQTKKLLPKGFFVLGVARSDLSNEVFAERTGGLANSQYLRGDYASPATYQSLKKELADLQKLHGVTEIVFYLAVPPQLYGEIPQQLKAAGLLEGQARVVVEKPFGHDLASAKELDATLAKALREDQLYRIDHYLGKETVQNILMFRFANRIFEPLWNREHIDHVQISVLESVALGDRAGYYDRSGVLRDMMQNHMTQLLALTAMEPPQTFDANRVRDEKVKLLRAVQPFNSKNWRSQVVLGQYEGYATEPGVASGSATPTYAALKMGISNWRWEGVPFYLRTGKALEKRTAEIAVHFKPVPHSLFSQLLPADLNANVLVFRIQPDEGVSLTIEAKKPGPKLCLGALTMDFDYNEVFGETPPGAYERLLLDCMIGDSTLFIRNDAVSTTWSLMQPLLEEKLPLLTYPRGSWGPREADELLENDARMWRAL